jgi:large subunit ribosomal protein L30
MLKVTLKKSPIKSTKSQRECVKGLRKLNSTRLLPDTPEVRGMIGKVSHIVECEDIAD